MKYIYDKKTRCVVQKPEPEPFSIPLPSPETWRVYEEINAMMDDMLTITGIKQCNLQR